MVVDLKKKHEPIANVLVNDCCKNGSIPSNIDRDGTFAVLHIQRVAQCTRVRNVARTGTLDLNRNEIRNGLIYARSKLSSVSVIFAVKSNEILNQVGFYFPRHLIPG